MTHTARRGASGRGLLAALVLIVVCILLFGFWRGWFSLSTAERSAEDQRDVTLTIDKQRIEDDAGRVRQRAEAVGELVEAAAEVETVTGTITSIDPADGALTIATEGGESITFNVDRSAEVEIDDRPSTLESLKEGDRVSVAYRDKDDRYFAQKISRLEEGSPVERADSPRAEG